MFAIFLSILVVMSLLSIYSNIVMRIRLTRAEPSRDRLGWWRRGSDEVTSMYEELFPGSYLPFFHQTVFWLVLASALLVLVASLWKSS